MIRFKYDLTFNICFDKLLLHFYFAFVDDASK